MAAGVAPTAFYMPWRAPSLSDSYVNLVNPGVNNASPGVAPTWHSRRGWIFNGTTQYLDTGIVPAAGWTMLLLFRSNQQVAVIAGSRNSTTVQIRIINDPATGVVYANGGLLTVAPYLVDGCLAVAGQQGYRNGVADGGAISAWSGTATNSIWIGGYSVAGALTSPFKGDVLAVMLWNQTLSAGQVTQVYNALMGQTFFDGLKVASGATLWSTSGAHDWLGRPVLINNDGTWVSAYRSATKHAYDGTTARIHLRFSADEGVTWSAEDTLVGGGAITGAPFAGHGPTSSAHGVDLMRAPNGDLLLHVGEVNSLDGAVGVYQWRSVNDGGAWVDEGPIMGDLELFNGQDYKIVGSDIYLATWRDPGSNSVPLQTTLHKSSDNGLTWEKVSDVSSLAEQTNESAIAHIGGTRLLCMMRDDNAVNTYIRYSEDMGLTWGPLITVTDIFSIFQRPRFRYVGNRLYVCGRTFRVSGSHRTTVWYSDDHGSTWYGPYYIGPVVSDAAYCDLLPRANGDLVVQTYEGTTTAAAVVQYVVEVDR